MKNLPEKELFGQLENRLRNYTEEPDEKSWDEIAGVLHGGADTSRGVWFERTADSLAILLLLFLFWTSGSVLTTGNVSSGLSSDGSVTDSVSLSEIHGELRSEAQSETEARNSNEELNSEAVAASEAENSDRMTSDIKKEKSVTTLRQIAQVVVRPDQVSSKSDPSGSTNENSTEYAEVIPVLSEEISSATQSNLQRRTDSKSLPVADSVSVKEQPVPMKRDEADAEKTEQKKKAKAKRKTQSYFMATPSLAFHKAIPTENDEVVVKGIVPESMVSSNRLGISLEAGLQRSVAKRLEVYAGVSYYRQDQKIKYEYQTNGPVTVEPLDGGGFSISPEVEQEEFDYKMRNLGVSAGMLYLIKGGKLQHKAGLGLQYQQGLAKVSGESGYENISSQYLSYQLSYRLDFQINKRTVIFLQPTFIHSFYSKEKLNEPFELKPYRAGLGLGILYSF